MELLTFEAAVENLKNLGAFAGLFQYQEFLQIVKWHSILEITIAYTFSLRFEEAIFCLTI